MNTNTNSYIIYSNLLCAGSDVVGSLVEGTVVVAPFPGQPTKCAQLFSKVHYTLRA